VKIRRSDITDVAEVISRGVMIVSWQDFNGSSRFGSSPEDGPLLEESVGTSTPDHHLLNVVASPLGDFRSGDSTDCGEDGSDRSIFENNSRFSAMTDPFLWSELKTTMTIRNTTNTAIFVSM
jgi:hypothetical protein